MAEKPSPMDLLCNILAQYMDLPGRVVQYNQGWHAPENADEYIIVSAESAQVVGKSSKFDPETNTTSDAVSMIGHYNIDLASRNKNALARKEEIVLALNSTLAFNFCEANNMRVWITGNILDLSAIEGASVLARYRIPVAVSYLKEKIVAADYFDKFGKPKILMEA